jgi:hypothetical protein
MAVSSLDEGMLARAQWELLRQYLFEVIVPIFYDNGETLEAIGTGTLLDVGDHLLLVTAAHVLEGYDGSKLVSPWDRKSGKTASWGTHGYLTPKSSDRLDVAMVELQYPETVADFRKNYRRLTLDQIAAPSTEGATYILAGYPECMTTVDDTMINQRPIAFYTEILTDTPKGWVNFHNPSQDLFFKLGTKARELFTGEEQSVPKLQGASGCVIWELSPYDGPLWTPQKALKAVGIQRSAKPADGWFRATKWLPVAGLIAKFDRRAAALLTVSLVGEERVQELLRESGV